MSHSPQPSRRWTGLALCFRSWTRQSSGISLGKAQLTIIAWWAFLFLKGHAVAQLQPENVFVVVNSRSWSSQTVANHFVHLRDIPASNIFALDWPGSVVEVDIGDFRKWILQPILDEIRSRNLERQIDCVVYSTDFPYAVSFASDFKGRAPGAFNVGSITGLTFHYRTVLAESTEYASVPMNRYADSVLIRSITPELDNQQNLLSMMLGYTSGRGNSVDEVMRSLTRSRFADGVFPHGTFYFMTNQDIRSTTRSGRFPAVIQTLQREGLAAAKMEGVYPQNRRDILGVMMGFSWFDWRSIVNSRVIPGAICENLTSYGAILDELSAQTPISEFVRWGAAGTTGTVVEPYALAAKFPDPAVHLQYAMGYSLTEAIYASVRAPYQLLAVGDPLCRTWADQLPIQVDGLVPHQEVKGEFEIHPRLPADAKVVTPVFELFVDGRRIASCERNQSFRLNAQKIPSGYHDAIITMRDGANLHVYSRRHIPFEVDQGEQSFTAELIGGDDVIYNRTAMIAVQPKGIQRVLAFHGRTLVGQQVLGEEAKDRLLAVDSRTLGFGTVELQLVGLMPGGHSHFGRPLRLKVVPDEPLPAQYPLVGAPTAELTLIGVAGPAQEIESTKDQNWLQTAGVKDGEPFSLTARFEAETTALYQLQAVFMGNITARLDNDILFAENHPGYMRSETPMYLEKGSHELFVSGRLDDVSLFELRFGHRGARRIGRSEKIP